VDFSGLAWEGGESTQAFEAFEADSGVSEPFFSTVAVQQALRPTRPTPKTPVRACFFEGPIACGVEQQGRR